MILLYPFLNLAQVWEVCWKHRICIFERFTDRPCVIQQNKLSSMQNYSSQKLKYTNQWPKKNREVQLAKLNRTTWKKLHTKNTFIHKTENLYITKHRELNQTLGIEI